MTSVHNFEASFLPSPFHLRIRSQPSVRTSYLGDVNSRWSAWRRSDYFYPEMTPEPDYSDTEEESEEVDEDDDESNDSADERLRDVETMEDDGRRHRVRNRSGDADSKHRNDASSRSKKSHPHSSEELIQPRKPSNPYLESMERKNLHKELNFNQKYGKTVGSHKTELQVALEKYTEGKIKRDLASRRSSLEKILEQQAQKIEQQEKEGNDIQPSWIDRLQRQHITSRADPKTDEFFRVHARVVSNFMTSSGSDDSGESSSTTSSSTSPSESE